VVDWEKLLLIAAPGLVPPIIVRAPAARQQPAVGQQLLAAQADAGLSVTGTGI
jgi:hypothetical protein